MYNRNSLSLLISFIIIVTIVYACKKSGSNFNSIGFVAKNIPDTIPNFKAIIGGTFIMGSPDGTKGTVREIDRDTLEVQHTVNISSFYMSKTEVSVKQYRDFCNATGLSMPVQPTYSQDNHPVVNVTWLEAAAYAAYYGCRLPREAEWEYACRGRTTTSFYTGNCINPTQANYNWRLVYGNCTTSIITLDRTSPVDSFPPNSYGLYNMSGNVWEWCGDWYGAYDTAVQTNPTGPTTGSNRVVRGGGWFYAPVNLRSASRNSTPPNIGSVNIGFRLVKEAR